MAGCLAMMTAFTGCKDNNGKDDETGILKPIAEHITGKWNIETSYAKKDGKWEESPMPEGQGQTYTIRTDGTVMSAVTAGRRLYHPQGRQMDDRRRGRHADPCHHDRQRP